jgi:hypothetical protein
MWVNWAVLSLGAPKLNSIFLGSAEFCEKYAKPEDAGITPEDNSSDEELSEEDDDDSGDDEPIMGHPDP